MQRDVTDAKEIRETEETETEKQPEESVQRESKSGIKKAAAGAAAGLAATSLLLGSIFSSPAEVMQQVNPDDKRPAVIVEIQAAEEEEPVEEEEEADEKKRGLKDMIKRFVQSLPSWAKVLFVIPLWAIGYGVIALLTALFEPVIAPVLSVILKWLLIGGLLAGGLFCIKKAIAPDMPLREIFTKRNMILVAVAAAVLGLGDYFAKNYFEHYELWRNVIGFAAGLLILGIYALRTWQHKKKTAAEAAA